MLGETISHYRISKQLGAGGMGVVYEAVDTKLDRTVALKFLPPESIRDPQAKLRFIREAKAAAGLSHPNIATIHEIDEVDGQLFIVMECVEGQSLKEKIASGPLPVAEALDLGRQIAAGLQEAHDKGIVHRDIKPANVMVTPQGVAKILDFGLARRSDATQLTQPGTTLGTVHYMSPEQARGDAVDARTDLWSAGVIFYECLTGRLPFHGEPASALAQLQTESPQPPSSLRSDVPLELESVILRCLQKDPDLRYQHADELGASLRLLDSQLGQAAATTGTAATAPPSNRRRGLMAVGLVALIVIAWWVLGNRQSGESIASQGALAVGDFLSPESDAEIGASFGLLVHMGLLKTDHDLWILDPQWLEHQRNQLRATNANHEPSAIDVAHAARANYLLHGRLSRDQNQEAAECLLLDLISGRTVAAWSEIAPTTRTLAARVAKRALEELLPSETLTTRAPNEELGTENADAWQAYLRAERAHAAEEWEDYREELLTAVEIDSTFALAAYDYAMVAARQWPDSSSLAMVDLAWRHRTELDVQRRLILEAKRHEFAGDLHASAALLREVNQRWPEDEDSAIQLASYLYYWMHLPELSTVVSKSLEYFPKSLELRFYNATCLGFIGKLDAAQAEFQYLLEREVETYGEDSEAVSGTRLTLADLALVRGKPSDAEAILQRPMAGMELMQLQARAMVLHARGKLEEAMGLLRAAGADDAQHPDFGAFLGGGYRSGTFALLLCEAGRTREYVALMDVLIPRLEGRPVTGFLVTLLDYGRSDLFADRIRDRQALEVAWRLFPEPVARSLELSMGVRTALVEGRIEAARDSVDALTAYVRAPDVPGGWVGVAFSLRTDVALAERDPKAALSELRAWKRRGRLAKPFADLSFRRKRIEALQAAEWFGDAAAEARDLLQHYAGHALGHLELARIQVQLHEPEDACASYERFFEFWKNADEDHPVLLAARAEYEALGVASD